MNRKQQCKAEYHSSDGLDSLAYGSHTLFCQKEKGHVGKHEYYSIGETEVDNTKNCDCPRCLTPTQKSQP